MKKMIWLVMTVVALYSCNNESEKTTDVIKDSTTIEPTASSVNYPYTIEHPNYWEMGSNENTKIALSALKAYENGNIDECVKYFGDSVHLQFDGMDATLPGDSLKAMFTKSRSDIKNMEIKMSDWESVISKDKKVEYVSLWYKQIWEDNKGKKDSVALIDDIELKNGKIIGLDEKSRKYPGKKM
ncbi:MAG: hypothetical protein ABI683_06650 [Ginsengibacter sp.]